MEMENIWKDFVKYVTVGNHSAYEAQKKFAKHMPQIRRYVLDGGVLWRE